MAYEKRGLRTFASSGQLAQAKVASLHAYITNDTAAVVEAAGYFDEAAGYMDTGDLLFASLDVDGTIAARIYVVTVTGTVVSLTLATATAAA